MAKRLKRTAKTIVLRNGQRITLAEQRALQNAVTSANRKRKRLLEKMPRKAKESHRIFGKESDFVVRKKSAKLSQFRNRGEFKRYLASVQKVASGRYERKRAYIYRENYIEALRKTFNSRADEAIKIVNKMSLEQFKYIVENEELENIGYVYFDPHNDKLKRIMGKLEAYAS